MMGDATEASGTCVAATTQDMEEGTAPTELASAEDPQKLVVEEPEMPEKSRAQWWNEFFIDNHLIVFLAIAFLLGLSMPGVGKELSKPQMDMGKLGQTRVANLLLLVMIFMISGFRLKTDAVVGALRSPKALIVAMVLILLVTPCVGFATAALPLATKELAYGLTVFCCVPTTLTSGAALISGCRGTERAAELALMVTVATNLLGSFTTPLLLSLTLSGAKASIDTVQLLVKLVISILIPTLVGKALRDFIPGAAKFSKDKKVPLTILSNFCLCTIVWMSVSRAQEKIVAQPPMQILACIGCGLGLHFVFWAINGPLVTLARIQDIHQCRAVFLLTSQKTLPVSVAVIAGLPESFGDAGLIALPCIFGHLTQLLVDSQLVNRWSCSLEDPIVRCCVRFRPAPASTKE